MADVRIHAVRTESLTEALSSHYGWYDDDIAFIRPWGFELAAIKVPVELRYGRYDAFVPASHGEWLARHVPGAEVTVWEELGHMGDPESVLEDYRALVAASLSA